MTSPAPGASPELVRRSIVVVGTSAGGVAALRQLVAGLIQDVLLHGTTLDAEDVSAREGMLDS